MWNLTSDHLRKAKETLREQLAEMTARQADEVAALRAQHAREHRQLEDKLGQLHRLDTLIAGFVADWVASSVAAEEAEEAPGSVDQSAATDSPGAEQGPAEQSATAMNGRDLQPARSLIRFPNRRRLR